MGPFFLTAAMLGALAPLPPPPPPPVAELAVKAAFLPKFAPYVSWPPSALASAGSPIVLCIVGSDPFLALLDEAAAGLMVEQHPLVVRRLSWDMNAAACQIAYVSASPRRAATLRALRGMPVLTITDGGGADHGIVHFVLLGGRVRFAIDDAMAAASKLAISAKLLSLAVSVKPRGRA